MPRPSGMSNYDAPRAGRLLEVTLSRRCQRYAHADACALAWGRLDHQMSLEHADPFAHAGEPKARVIASVRIEADTGVRDAEMHLVSLMSKVDGCISRLTMFGDVVQRFLRDSVETQRHHRIDAGRQVRRTELDIDLAMLRHLCAEQADRLDQPQRLQARWMQLVREIRELDRDFADLGRDSFQSRAVRV